MNRAWLSWLIAGGAGVGSALIVSLVVNEVHAVVLSGLVIAGGVALWFRYKERE